MSRGSLGWFKRERVFNIKHQIHVKRRKNGVHVYPRRKLEPTSHDISSKLHCISSLHCEN